MNGFDQPRWWQRGIIYQIYPRSFMDASGNGVGDLPGIASRLAYLRWLGIDAIWLSPIYPSPMADFGYDVSDYIDVDPLFGTLADFDSMIAEARRQHLKVLLDFVPNHTSEQHLWFIDARSSRGSRYREWYLWRDPAPGGGPPNNWRSVFGGSAWEWDAATGQYYFHSYLKQQPDLNWRNPEVEQAMFAALRFWLDRGVDGFRIDAISRLIKDAQFRDNPPNPKYTQALAPYHELLAAYSVDQPEVHEVIARMRGVIDEYPDRAMIGEAYLPMERVVAYYGAGISFPFNFQLIKLPWHAHVVRQTIDSYERLLPPEHWPNWVLGNHDNHRIASRVGRDQARVAAMLLLTLRGTPTMYYGDELGMQDVPIPPELVQDPWEKNVPGFGLGRDPERTPMQWDASRGAGFTTGSPWLPHAADYAQVNVAAEREDPRSLLTLHRRLIALRAQHRALHAGGYEAAASNDATFLYWRRHQQAKFLVALNFSSEPVEVNLPHELVRPRILLSTHLDREEEHFNDILRLRASEGVLLAESGLEK